MTTNLPPPELRDRIKEMKEVPIGSIRGFSAGNPKLHTEMDRDILDNSLDVNGFAMPILVREVEPDIYETIDGHHRVERIIERYPNVGMIKVIVLDVESVAEGRKMILGLQHTAGWDMDALEVWMHDALADGLEIDDAMGLSGLTAADLESLADAGQELLDQLPDTRDNPPPPTDENAPPPSPRPLTPTERAQRIFIFDQTKIAEASFAHYRRAGFPYPDPSPAECMLSINRLASMPLDQLLRTHEGGPTADKFQRHRYEAEADGMISPYASFVDDKRLSYVINMIVDSTGTIGDGTLRSMLGMVQGAQSCSNFRPGFAAYLYRRFCQPGGTILDTSAGFGGRLVGALGSAVAAHYIGIDPNTPSLEGSRKLLAMLARETFATLIPLPAEDVRIVDKPVKDGISIQRNSCDFSFTSPPYFNKERYSDDPTQSGVRYPAADDWREKFLVPMMRLTFEALKPGAHAGINIADVLVEGVRHPLGDWTVLAGKRAGFEHVGTLDFPVGGSRRFGGMKGTAKEEESTEPVFLFQKPG